MLIGQRKIDRHYMDMICDVAELINYYDASYSCFYAILECDMLDLAKAHYHYHAIGGIIVEDFEYKYFTPLLMRGARPLNYLLRR